MTSAEVTCFVFGRDRRLRRRAEFLRVQSVGLRAHAGHFVMLVAARKLNKHDPNIPAGASPSRLGLVVTKKVGNAVARARLKRVCRECFRLWPGFVPEGIDLVVIAKIGADELGLAAVRTEWQRARGKLLERCRSVLSSVHDAGHEKAGASEFAASPFAPNPESKRGAPL